MSEPVRESREPMPLSGQAGRVLQLACQEAERVGHHAVQSAHLLLAILKEGGQPTAAYLAGKGITLHSIRDTLLEPEQVRTASTPTAAYMVRGGPQIGHASHIRTNERGNVVADLHLDATAVAADVAESMKKYASQVYSRLLKVPLDSPSVVVLTEKFAKRWEECVPAPEGEEQPAEIADEPVVRKIQFKEFT